MSKVYFVECAGRIKIGFSNNVQERLRQLSTGAPGPLNLITTIEGRHSLERAIHRHLKVHRVKGEWFEDCDEVRSIIRDLVSSGPSAIGFKENRQQPQAPDPSSAQVAITSLIKAKHPYGTKAWAHVCEVTGLKERAAKNRLSNRTAWTPAEFVAFLRREDGYDFLKAFMEDAKPDWWKPVPRAMAKFERTARSCRP